MGSVHRIDIKVHNFGSTLKFSQKMQTHKTLLSYKEQHTHFALDRKKNV